MKEWYGLRDFLSLLGDDVKTIRTMVDTKYEMAAYIRKTSDVEGPAFIFTNIRGYEGWRAAGGLFATRRRVAKAMRTDIKGVVKRFDEAIKNPVSPRLVNDGPCKDLVWKGKDVDLQKMPIMWQNDRDAAPFITGGVQVAKHPETSVRGLGMHRLQLKGPRKLGIAITGQRRINRFLIASEEKEKDLEIATVIGTDPSIAVASQAKVAHDVDKLDIAGALANKPVELVKCETIDVEVPADSEIVIEGRIKKGIREEEGPFAEFTGCYTGLRILPVIEVTAITMRNDPIYAGTALCGMPVTENNLLVWPAMSQVVYKQAVVACPEVKDVNLTGNGLYTAIVSIRKRTEKEALNVIYSVLGGALYPKFCIVVDDDIDIFDTRDVEWALQTRVQPHQDVQILPVMTGAVLDPSAPEHWQTSKMGIDATIPIGAPKESFQKAYVPGVDKVKW